MSFLLALSPLAVILGLMVGLRWGATRAGAAGYLTALLVASTFFGAGPILLAYAHARALFLSLDVLLIIWAAFFLYRVTDEAGAITTLGQALPHLTSDRTMQAVIIGWAFASFLQGVGGFGVPVAVVAPILIGLGFSPLAAVAIPSIGTGWAVTFGSLGSSFQALLAATGLPGALLAPPSALFLGLAALFTGPLVVQAAGGWLSLRRLWLPVILLGAVMGGGQYATAALAHLWNIGALAGGLLGLLASIPLALYLQRRRQDRGEATAAKGTLDLRTLAFAVCGYGILVIIILAMQLVAPLRDFLGRVVLQAQFPQVQTSAGYITPAGAGRAIPIFRHTGTVLVYVAVLVYLLFKWTGMYRPGAPRRILQGTLERVLPSSVSIIAMVTMAVIMEDAGMTETLAHGLATSVGRLFPFVSPWIGALGAFITGSNTNSNVIFAALQMRTAELLGFSVPIILAAQTSGAALASVMAPAKIVVGASTAAMAGQEGVILRHLLPFLLLLVLLISLLAGLFTFNGIGP